MLHLVGVVVEGIHDRSVSSSEKHPDPTSSGLQLYSADCSKELFFSTIPTPSGSDILKPLLWLINAFLSH